MGSDNLFQCKRSKTNKTSLMIILGSFLFLYGLLNKNIFINISFLVFLEIILLFYITKNKKLQFKVFVFLYLLIFLKIILSWYDTNVNHLPGLTADAIRFQRNASLIYENRDFYPFVVGKVQTYYNFMGFLYLIFGKNPMIVNLLASISLILLFNIILSSSTLNRKKTGCIITGIFLLPSQLVLSSGVLREPFLMLFFALIIFSSFSLLRRKSLFNHCLFLISLFIFSVFHKATLLMSVIIFFIYYLFFYFDNYKLKLIGVLFIFITLLFFLKSGIFENTLISTLLEENALEVTESYVYGGNIGRTHYKSLLNFNNIFLFIPSIFMNYINYLIRPFIWEVNSLFDLIVFIEGAFRNIFLFKILIFAYRLHKEKKSFQKQKTRYIMILTLILIVDITWSIGTKTWGTAIRHKMIVTPWIYYLYAERKDLLDKKNKKENSGNSRKISLSTSAI